MESKVWIGLCALLLMNLGSAEHDGGHTAASAASESDPEAPPAESAPGSSPHPILHTSAAPSPSDSDTSSNSTGSLSSNKTTEGESMAATPEPTKAHGTNTSSPTEAVLPGNVSTDESTPKPPVPPSESHTAASPTTPAPPTGTTHTTHTAAADKQSPTPPTAPHTAPPLPEVTASQQPSHNETHSSTHVPTPELPKLEPTTATVIAQTTSTASSSQEPHKSESPTLATQQTTSQSDEHPPTTSKADLKTTITQTTSPSAEARPHARTPSQLNVGGDPDISNTLQLTPEQSRLKNSPTATMVHASPTLDPLLAGLVSAFIITAVIITLLLFLKLRRRDNRPEFRRLQDLPMDDMMEDTPLSMYSY